MTRRNPSRQSQRWESGCSNKDLSTRRGAKVARSRERTREATVQMMQTDLASRSNTQIFEVKGGKSHRSTDAVVRMCVVTAHFKQW